MFLAHTLILAKKANRTPNVEIIKITPQTIYIWLYTQTTNQIWTQTQEKYQQRRMIFRYEMKTAQLQNTDTNYNENEILPRTKKQKIASDVDFIINYSHFQQNCSNIISKLGLRHIFRFDSRTMMNGQTVLFDWMAEHRGPVMLYSNNMISFHRRLDKKKFYQFILSLLIFSASSVHAWSLGAVTFVVGSYDMKNRFRMEETPMNKMTKNSVWSAWIHL